MAGRPARKQEVSVVVVGMGGEQKNWSRLKGKWAWRLCLPLAKYLLTTNRFICTEIYSVIQGETFHRILEKICRKR